MDYEDPYQDLYIHLKAGEQHLNGEEALQVMRFRSGYAMADLERVNVQRNFVQAAMDQWLNWTVIFRAPIAGAAVLLVSSELTEIMSLSDRIYVIYEGRINGEFKRNSMDDKRLGLLMVGGSIENE